MTNYNPGDIDISSIMMYNVDESKKLNILKQIRQIDIYEGIEYPTIYAEIYMYDALDLLNNFPIIGEEKIEIEFKTGNTNDLTKYTLFVADIPSKVVKTGDTVKKYMLRLCSEEHLLNQTFRISDKYSTQLSATIPKLLSKLDSKKSIVVEQTKGIDEILIPKMHVLEAIDFIKNRSVSIENVSSSYVFFENADGFKFVTIEKLIEDGTKKIGDKQFFFDQTSKVDSKSMQFRNIISMKETTKSSTVSKLNEGQNYSVKTFDIITGGISTLTYVNSRDQSKYKFSNKTNPTNSSRFESKYGIGASQVYFIPKDSSKPENFIEEKVTYQNAYLQRLLNNVNIVNIWGDSTLRAGDAISVKIPSASVDFTSSDRVDRMRNGNYLIKTLRHNIRFDIQRTYQCSLELIKGNYEDLA